MIVLNYTPTTFRLHVYFGSNTCPIAKVGLHFLYMHTDLQAHVHINCSVQNPCRARNIIFVFHSGGPGMGKTASIFEYRYKKLRDWTFFPLSCESRDIFMADLRKHVRKHPKMTLAEEDYESVTTAVKALIRNLGLVGDPFAILFDDPMSDEIRRPLLRALNELEPETALR